MKKNKIYGFKIGKHIVDIESHSEQEAFRLLGVNFWHLISNEETVELLGELKKVTEKPYKNDKGVTLFYKQKDNTIEIMKVVIDND